MSELGVILNDQVRRRFDDVKAFHHSVVRNRRRFLEADIQELTERLAARRPERADRRSRSRPGGCSPRESAATARSRSVRTATRPPSG
ncbi:ABC-three component system protein [Streptomyces toxytricini]